MEQAAATGLGYVGPERIDEINILQATYEAMRQAIGVSEIIQKNALLRSITAKAKPLHALIGVPIPRIYPTAKSVSMPGL